MRNTNVYTLELTDRQYARLVKLLDKGLSYSSMYYGRREENLDHKLYKDTLRPQLEGKRNGR